MTQQHNGIPQLIENSIHLLEGNLNSSFAEQLGEILNNTGVINTHQMWKPSIDIIETSHQITIYATIPGVSNDTIDVDFYNNIMTIKGERKFPPLDEQSIYKKREIIYGNFERKVVLPVSVVNQESVKVTSKDGLLIVTIDKHVESRNRFSVQPTVD